MTEQQKKNDKQDIEDKPEEKKHIKTKPVKNSDKQKIASLEAEIESLTKEKDSLKDQLLRKMAEFENYKRRSEKEFLSVLENANENLITEILPVLDDFERSLEHFKNSDNQKSLVEGVELIYKKLISILEKKGMKPMETIGKEFDPEMHQALMQVDSDKFKSGYIVDEHLKGYLLNDKVIRHAQVLVSK
ncbi:MAG: nucleotide exchange factor GrpE [Calditrichaceae bacterium]|nr:nucleotide exchange factor GrpE [Calditrichaceae bacterium]